MSCSGVSQDDKDRNTCQEMRVESSRAGHGRLFWRLSLWSAPWCQPPTPPPTTGCPGQPLPLRTSCLVLAGRSPGLEEPPHCDQSPSFSLPFLFILSFLIRLPVSLSSLLLFFFFSLPFPPTLHLILVSYLSICLPLNISDLSVLSLSPLSLNPQLSLSPLSWTPWPIVFVYITPDHQVRLLNTIIRTRAQSLAEPTPKSLLKRTSSLL